MRAGEDGDFALLVTLAAVVAGRHFVLATGSARTNFGGRLMDRSFSEVSAVHRDDGVRCGAWN